MNIVAITGLCIVATIVIKLFDKTNKEYGLVIGLATAGFILLLAISYLSPIVSAIENLFDISGVPKNYLEIIFKSIGICYLTQLGCDYCKDANENVLASELELAGKISLLIIALPLFSELVDIIKRIISL